METAMSATADETASGAPGRDTPATSTASGAAPSTEPDRTAVSSVPYAAAEPPERTDDELARRRGDAIADVAAVAVDQAPADTAPDPQLVAHVAKALADLRLLTQFVASTPDRRFVDAQPAIEQGVRRWSETPASGLSQMYDSTLRIAGMTADRIAADAKLSAQLFFLLDRLSTIAHPASPDSIRLTAAYLRFPLGGGEGGADGALQEAASEEAKKLRSGITTNRAIMGVVFCLAISMSIYALFGQVLLGERDRIVAAIGREADAFYSQTRLTLPAQIFRLADQQHIFLVNPQEMQNWIMEICPPIRMVLPSPVQTYLPPPVPMQRIQEAQEGGSPDAAPSLVPLGAAPSAEPIRIYPSAEFMRHCDEFEYLEAQRRQADRAVSDWVQLALGIPEWVIGHTIALLDGAPRQAHDDRPPRNYSYRPWGETIVTAMGSYILPILFGVIGAWAASERELRRRLERFEVTRSDRHTYRRGLLLGGVVGGVVGLFFSTDTLKNLSLTYSAIALVAGFAGDRVFRFLDDLINRIFSIERPPPGGRAQLVAK